MQKETQSKLFIYFLPVYYIYNMLIDTVFTRGGEVGIIFNITILALFFYFSAFNTHIKKFWYIFVWIIFNVILIISNSSKIMYSFVWFAKNTIGVLCLPLSFYLISTNEQIIRFLKVLIAVMLLYVLNLVLANLLGWGNAYGGENAEFAVQGGAAIVTGSMPAVVALMMGPFILSVIPKKNLFISIWCISIACVFLIFKRTNIASLILGYAMYIILFNVFSKKSSTTGRRKSSKKKTIQLTLLFVIFLIPLIIFLWPFIVAQFDIRSHNFEEGAMNKEGRVIEWQLVKGNILESRETSVILFGKEPYNTPGNYGYPTMRNIHGDYSMILFSTGVVGFLFYWTMQIYIALLALKYGKRRYLQNKQDVMLIAIYLSSSIIWFLFSFSATLEYVLVTSVYYMMHGMILRFFWNKQIAQETSKLLQA